MADNKDKNIINEEEIVKDGLAEEIQEGSDEAEASEAEETFEDSL